MLGTNDKGRVLQGRQAFVEGTLTTTGDSGLVIGVVFPSLVLVTVVTVLRLLVRKTMPPKRLFLDDAWVVVAALLTVALCMVSIEGAKHGLGQHEWNLDNHDGEIQTTVMLMWAGQLIYSFAISAAKISIISSYFRIFPYKRFHQGLWVVLAVTLAFLVASVVATIFICRPVEAAWDPRVRTPMSCYRFIDVLYANAIVNVTTDLILCMAPLPYFLRLSLPLKQKICASVLFIAGGLCAVASLIRLSGLYEISPDGEDITYHIAEPLVWSVLECTISIVCISIPPMRPLFAKAVPGTFESQDQQQNHQEKRTIKRISKRLGTLTIKAIRHPLGVKSTTTIPLTPPRSLLSSSPTGGTHGHGHGHGHGHSHSHTPYSADSLSNQGRHLQLIPSFEKIDTPLGSTETVVISMREMEEGESGKRSWDGRERDEGVVIQDHNDDTNDDGDGRNMAVEDKRDDR